MGTFREVTETITGGCACACHTGIGADTSCQHCGLGSHETLYAVTAFNQMQQSGQSHPFTCGNDEHGESIMLVAVEVDGGALLMCAAQACTYVQGFPFMIGSR